MRHDRCAAGFGLAAALTVLAGCGQTGPTYYHVAGTVTFGGQPVPKGTVTFEPDAAKGVRGQMGYADLVDGKFDTRAAGKGVLGGAYVVRILGYDGKAAYEAPYGNGIFPEYTITRDLPKEDSTLTIDVPRKRN
jgi:Prokaryotic lipoprotein-attachment site